MEWISLQQTVEKNQSKCCSTIEMLHGVMRLKLLQLGWHLTVMESWRLVTIVIVLLNKSTGKLVVIYCNYAGQGETAMVKSYQQ